MARWIEATQAQIDEVFGAGDAAGDRHGAPGRGHVPLEGVPGMGKTLLARTPALCSAASRARQRTPDLMPSDVVGTTICEAEEATFRFRPGPVFADLFLVDEINRMFTSTALFDDMDETPSLLTASATTPLSEFKVVATQNPIEQGTYPLESVIDRFLIHQYLSGSQRSDLHAMRVPMPLPALVGASTLRTACARRDRCGCRRDALPPPCQRTRAVSRVDTSVLGLATQARAAADGARCRPCGGRTFAGRRQARGPGASSSAATHARRAVRWP